MIMTFDVEKIGIIHAELVDALTHLRPLLPCTPHPYHIKRHFCDKYWLTLPNAKIGTLKKLLQEQDTTTELFDDLAGLLEYLKLETIVRNYTSQIIKHEGRVPLKEVNGEWRFPNGQQLPQTPEIANCKQ